MKMICGGNIKLGNMGSFSKLYGTRFYTVNGITEKGTCGKYCESCEFEGCYVGKSYRYPSVIKGHLTRTHAMREDIKAFFESVSKELSRKKKPFNTVRLNQSGELESVSELCGWIAIAKQNPNTVFYIYTKAFDIVEKVLDVVTLPNNFYILISVWHEYGEKEFNKYSENPQVKAFVYDDNTYEYSFTCDTYCKAYDDKGKLNHELTCEKCRKCFDNNKNHKVIGCKAH